MTPEHCPTCGSVVKVVTADEGTSSYRPHLVTDEMVVRAADAIADEFLGLDRADFKRIARRALEAALEEPS